MRIFPQDVGVCLRGIHTTRRSAVLWVALLIFFSLEMGAAPQTQPSQSAPTVASVVDREISNVEKLVTEAAEAMPEENTVFRRKS